jgi:hypothetical protein
MPTGRLSYPSASPLALNKPPMSVGNRPFAVKRGVLWRAAGYKRYELDDRKVLIIEDSAGMTE